MLRKCLTRILSASRLLRRPPHFSMHGKHGTENQNQNQKLSSTDLEQQLFGFNKTASAELKSKVPHISIDSFVESGEICVATGESIVAALRDFGCVAIKDPRVNANSNVEFVEMMGSYFQSRAEKFERGEQMDEMFPELGYETGITPEFTERARVHRDTIAAFQEEHYPLTPQPPPKDSKWRFMYKVGDRKDSEDLAMPRIVPQDFPRFQELSDTWSNYMVQTLFSVSQLLAVGLGLEQDALLSKMLRGAHILGPTGSDIEKHDIDTILAGFHYDFCLLTIHGKSNFPGLYIWLHDGTKLPVVLDDGYLLIQSGLELEIFTGGLIKAGLHEVVVTQRAKEILQERKNLGIPNANWRVSSTVFGHVEHDCVIEPLGHFATEEALELYPPITGLDLMKRELSATDML